MSDNDTTTEAGDQAEPTPAPLPDPVEVFVPAPSPRSGKRPKADKYKPFSW